MQQLRHILLTILVVCTLCTSSAWAYDDHVVSIDVVHQHDHADETLSDHCGHLSAHVVGLLSEVTFKLDSTHLDVQPEASERFVSFVPLLSLKPPSL